MEKHRRNLSEENNFEGIKEKRSKKSSNVLNSVKLISTKDINIFDLDSNNYSNDYLEFIDKINKNIELPKIKPEYFGINYNDIIDIQSKSNKEKIPFDENKIKKLTQISEFKLITPLEIYYKHEYEKFHKYSNALEKCSICLCEFYDDLFDNLDKEVNSTNEKTNKKENKINPKIEIISKYQKNNKDFDVILLQECKDHFFHIDCLFNLVGSQKHLKCPNCSFIYGKMEGDQPNGKMSFTVNKRWKCEGFKNCGTIVIKYNFPDGDIYSGTTREVYLPENKEGKEIMALLRIAFERRLLFTIGTSVTTGVSNTTIWNGVHQKTNTSGGSHNFGYPDPTYFNRVKNELAAKGVNQIQIEKEFGDLENLANKFLKEKSFSNLEAKKLNRKRK